MDIQKLKTSINDWLDAWNKKDIHRILTHYSESIEFYSATVTQRWGKKEGKLTGKAELERHFLKGFELVPDLRFELLEVLSGMDGIVIVYKRETGRIVADYVVPDDNGRARVVKVFAS